MPKSLQRCVTSLSVSSNVPSSSKNSTRSRADILPSLCCRSWRCVPPPSSARRSRFFSSSSFCSKFMPEIIAREQDGLRKNRVAAGDSPALCPGFLQVAERRSAGQPLRLRSGQARAAVPTCLPLLHRRPEWLVPILLPIPKHSGDGAFPLVRFRREDRRNGLFVERQLFHHHFLER